MYILVCMCLNELRGCWRWCACHWFMIYSHLWMFISRSLSHSFFFTGAKMRQLKSSRMICSDGWYVVFFKSTQNAQVIAINGKIKFKKTTTNKVSDYARPNNWVYLMCAVDIFALERFLIKYWSWVYVCVCLSVYAQFI